MLHQKLKVVQVKWIFFYVYECGTNTVQTKAKGRNKVKVSAYLKHLLV